MNINFTHKHLATPIVAINCANMLKQILLASLFGFIGLCSLQAQDIHFSQFYNAPLNISPALTGIYQGDVRFIANYRSQWEQVPVKYRTASASADMKFLNSNFQRSFFSGGLLINYDQAGTSQLSAVNIGLTGTYTRQLSSNFYTTAGALFGFNQRGFNMDDLLFDRQWNGDVVDPGLSNGEAFSSTSRIFFDFSAGLNFRWQQSTNAQLVNRLEKRSKVDFGVALYHISQPDQAFYEDDEARLFMRLSPYIHSKIQVGKEVDVITNANVQMQGPYFEALGVIGGRFYFNRELGKQTALQFNVGYRFDDFGDAVFPGFELYYNEIHLGLTYDINISDFDVATGRYGGWELSFRYIITKVKPLPVFKICPLI